MNPSAEDLGSLANFLQVQFGERVVTGGGRGSLEVWVAT